METYKLIAYVDDVKPSITSMNEFSVVDRGSALFEAASGCVLHRDPASGKVKFLPLGRWKGTLTRALGHGGGEAAGHLPEDQESELR